MKRLLILLLLFLLMVGSVHAAYTAQTHPNPTSLYFGIKDSTLYVDTPSVPRSDGVKSAEFVTINGDSRGYTFVMPKPLKVSMIQTHLKIVFDCTTNKDLVKGTERGKIDCGGNQHTAYYTVSYSERRNRVYLRPWNGPGKLIDYERFPSWWFTPIVMSQVTETGDAAGISCIQDGNEVPCRETITPSDDLVLDLQFIVENDCVTGVALKEDARSLIAGPETSEPPTCKERFWVGSDKGRDHYRYFTIDAVNVVEGNGFVRVTSEFTGKTYRLSINPEPLWYAFLDAYKDILFMKFIEQEGRTYVQNLPKPFTEISFTETNLCDLSGPDLTMKLCVAPAKKTSYSELDQDGCTSEAITTTLKEIGEYRILSFSPKGEDISRHFYIFDGEGEVTSLNPLQVSILPFIPFCELNLDSNDDDKVTDQDAAVEDAVEAETDSSSSLNEWSAKIEQKQKCEPNKECEFTFSFEGGASSLPNATIIGFIHNGQILQGTVGDKNLNLRWVIDSQKVKNGITKKITFLTIPDGAKAFVFPANLIEPYQLMLEEALNDGGKKEQFEGEGINSAQLIWSPKSNNIHVLEGSVHEIKKVDNTPQRGPTVPSPEQTGETESGSVVQDCGEKCPLTLVEDTVDDPRFESLVSINREITMSYVKKGNEIVAILRHTPDYESSRIIVLGETYGISHAGGILTILKEPVTSPEIQAVVGDDGVNRLAWDNVKPISMMQAAPGTQNTVLFDEENFCAFGDYALFSFTLPYENDFSSFTLAKQSKISQPKISFCTDNDLRHLLNIDAEYQAVQLEGTLGEPTALSLSTTIGGTIVNTVTEKVTRKYRGQSYNSDFTTTNMLIFEPSNHDHTQSLGFGKKSYILLNENPVGEFTQNYALSESKSGDLKLFNVAETEVIGW
jgi:hypothetical protein